MGCNKSSIRKTKLEGMDLSRAMTYFLIFHDTPHISTGIPSALLMLRRALTDMARSNKNRLKKWDNKNQILGTRLEQSGDQTTEMKQG